MINQGGVDHGPAHSAGPDRGNLILKPGGGFVIKSRGYRNAPWSLCTMYLQVALPSQSLLFRNTLGSAR
jgi:hypothetical protein